MSEKKVSDAKANATTSEKRGDTSASKKADDVALVVGASKDASQVAVLRKKGDEVSAAVLQAPEAGQPVTGDLVSLRPREDSPLFDVETVYEAPKGGETASKGTGHSRPATDQYRKGWDRIFKKKRTLH